MGGRFIRGSRGFDSLTWDCPVSELANTALLQSDAARFDSVAGHRRVATVWPATLIRSRSSFDSRRADAGRASQRTHHLDKVAYAGGGTRVPHDSRLDGPVDRRALI